MIFHGDCLEKMKDLESDSIDSLVTDPPAGISFMGKAWDGDKGGRDQWVSWMTEVMQECLRVLKPGAHGLVWALPRTSHWTAIALENAGFEVRDVVTHLFGTGFPKSLDISKAIDKAAGAEREVIGKKPYSNQDTRGNPISKTGGWGTGLGQDKERLQLDVTAPATDAAKKWQGYGTALKPASEHWILIRKPLSEKTVAANVLKHGTGGINIDGCRIGTEVRYNGPASTNTVQTMGRPEHSGSGWNKDYQCSNVTGRFPANLVLDEHAAELLDGQSGVLKSGDLKPYKNTENVDFKSGLKFETANRQGDSGGASRFFYVAKASKSDKGADNTHPTVKSTKLMEYLIKLITPTGGTVLDPFAGSGSTLVSAKNLGFNFIGVEQNKEYFDIIESRIK
jgi:DNA modification methylase